MDRVQKIRSYAEKFLEIAKVNVQRAQEENDRISYLQFSQAVADYERVVNFIDTMQEKPKKCMYTKDHYTDEDRKVLCEDCEEECKFAKKEEPVNKQSVEEAMAEVEEKAKAFTEAHKDESSEQLLAEMRGEDSVNNKLGGINNALIQDRYVLEQYESEELEAEINRYLSTWATSKDNGMVFCEKMARHFVAWQKQRGYPPQSDDLEEEIRMYMKEHLVGSGSSRINHEIWGGYIARHFAAWQKEQDKQWLAENHKHIFAKGRESAEVWISTDDDVKNAAEKTTRRFCKISLLSGDYLSLAEAQPQVNKESKLIAIKSFVCGAQWDRNKLMKDAICTTMQEDDCGDIVPTIANQKGFKIGDKVKLIILKEE